MDNLSVGFNQDCSLITVGSGRGFRVYRCNPFKKCFQAVDGSIQFVEMLFSTSLVALVGSGKEAAFSPRRIRMFNTKTRKFICELDFAGTILNVKMNRKRLVAVLENKIHIFDLETLYMLHTLRTTPNKKGVIALSTNIRNGFMALPGHDSKGEILVYDVINCQLHSKINACNNPVQNLSMNAEGTLLAAASTQGTVIRVFSVPEGTKLHTFRRGSYPVTIHSIAFNPSSSLIAVSSSSSTIHIFELKVQDSNPKPQKASSSTLAKYLPNLLSDIVEPGRHFAYVTLKESSYRTVVAFGDGELLVLSEQGYFCRYTIPNQGGECKLDMESPLKEKPDEEMGVKIHGKGGLQALLSVQGNGGEGNLDNVTASKEKKSGSSRPLLTKEYFEDVFFEPTKEEKEDVDRKKPKERLTVGSHLR
ncbi:hypothetical protein AAMO2058_000624400 [Amorphochlora amoebiformis]